MLRFLVKKDHAHFVVRIRNRLPDEVARSVGITAYEDLLQNKALMAGTYVFTSLGVMGASQRVLATTIRNQLASAGCGILNHPTESLNRLDLLTEMYGLGINSFRAFRVDDIASHEPTYPVFIREARRHSGSLTDLIQSGSELQQAIDDVAKRGYRTEDLIVVEFCETVDSEGIYRKYSAFRVGDAIIPRYLDFSRDWVVKRTDKKLGTLFLDDRRQERADEQFRYVSDNPHESVLRVAFDAARIEYGRIDYGISDGRPQIWEINTAPSFGTGLVHLDPVRKDLAMLRRPAAQVFYDRFLPALTRLSKESAGARGITVAIETPIRRAVEREIREESRSARVRSIVNMTSGAFRNQRFDRLRRLIGPVIVRACRSIS